MSMSEVRRALTMLPALDFARLNEIANLQPIVAKRHYHRNRRATLVRPVAIAPLAETFKQM